MSRSAYHRIARLATHPAWSHRHAALKCPICPTPTTFAHVPLYERHFLTHQPTAEQAWQWLSGRAYRQLHTARGWPAPQQMPDLATRETP